MKILVVEDDPDIQIIARMSLETVGGHEVEICSGGAEALEAIATFPAELVLLDVMMPGMDGPTTLSSLRASDEGRDVPVIFMTAKVQSHDRERYMGLGALDVIAKPFDPMALPGRIAAIFDERTAG